MSGVLAGPEPQIQFSEVPHGSPAYRATLMLREELLRAPLGLSFSSEELAAESDSHHLCAFEGSQLIGCLVLKPLEQGRVRMRQVAVMPALQTRGIGSRLVHYAEQVARAYGYSMMVVHARTGVVPFYVRLGYVEVGERFTEVTIPHAHMEKPL
ncbi:MAG TPA: GNAT family N-acetyltransferase [Polyangiaceae bacterium]